MPFLPGMPLPAAPLAPEPEVVCHPVGMVEQRDLFPRFATDEERQKIKQEKARVPKPDGVPNVPRYVECHFKGPPNPGHPEDDTTWYGVVEDRHVNDYRRTTMERWPGTVCVLIRSVP